MSSKYTNILRGEAYKDDTSVPVSLFINYPESENDAIECDVLFDNVSQVQSVYNNNGFLQIRSNTLWYLERLLWIPFLSIYSILNHQTFRGTANLLFEGNLDKFNTDNGLADCYILIHENELYDEKHPISWETPFGHAELKYDYPYGEPFHTIQNPHLKKLMIYIKLDFNLNKWDSREKFLLDVSDYLDNLMYLFSFLCKRYIWWYRLNLLYYPENSPSDVVIINGYKNSDIVKRNSKRNNFVGIGGISSNILVKKSPEGLISGVILEYFKSEYMRFIQKLISMVMITLTDSVLEQDLGIIYTALETLVSRFHQKDSEKKNSKFTILSESSSLEEWLVKQTHVELDQSEKKSIKEAIKSLNRMPLKKKLLNLFEEKLRSLKGKLAYNLTPDLLINHLEEAINRRNDYIHRGDVDVAKALGDISLIRFIVCIWILDLLGYPLKEINSNEKDLTNIWLYKNR